MQRWAHYRFRRTLIDKCEITNTKIIVGSEEYTIKRCTKCKRIKLAQQVRAMPVRESVSETQSLQM